jgi:hypothetical protein
MNDEVLMSCNATELLCLARQQGLGLLRKDLPKEVLVRIVSGEMDPTMEHLSGTTFTRQTLESAIQANFAVVRSQLPGCNGMCRSFPCSEGRHALCFLPNATQVTP